MMKKYIVTISFFVVVVLTSFAQNGEKLRVAVFDPSISGPALGEGVKLAVRELIGATLVNYGDYTILERSMLDKVMAESQFSNTDAVDENSATALGKLAGANKVVLSVVSQAGSKNMLSVKMIDVETASIERQKTKVCNPDRLLDEVEPLVGELLGQTVASSGAKMKRGDKSSSASLNANGLDLPNIDDLPENTLIGGICYKDSDGKPVRMVIAMPSGSKSKFGMKVAVKIQYPNSESPNTISNNQPEFYVLLGKVAKIDSVRLVNLEKGKQDRKYKWAVATAFGVKYCDDFIPYTVTDMGDGVYMIKPSKPLKKGCYGIYYQYGDTAPQMYDFDIK